MAPSENDYILITFKKPTLIKKYKFLLIIKKKQNDYLFIFIYISIDITLRVAIMIIQMTDSITLLYTSKQKNPYRKQIYQLIILQLQTIFM